MKTSWFAIGVALLLASCVFEEPFQSEARVPVKQEMLGIWEEVSPEGQAKANRMLVLQHSANEYLVEYPAGPKGMRLRTYEIELAGAPYFQVQFLGTGEGPANAGERKYHLFKVKVDGEQLEMGSIDPEVVGTDHKTVEALRTAFEEHKSDAKLFAKPQVFRRVK